MASSLIILSYPGALQSAVLGLSDMLRFAGLQPVVVRDEADLPKTADVVILPPGERAPSPADASWIVDLLRERSEAGALICSACLGLTWVAASGIDAGRPVTTHWGIGSDIKATWPGLQVDTDRLLIEYFDLVTAGGLMAWVDLALIVIERLVGHQAMLTVARHFVVDPGRRDQRRFKRFQPKMDHGDKPVLQAQRVLESDIARAHRIGDLAQQVGLSPRTFQRRFAKATGLSVTEYGQRVRMEQAKALLANTQRSIPEVSAEVGYSDVPAFYRVFQKLVGMPPAGFRAAVQG